jgi:hypothetical protein
MARRARAGLDATDIRKFAGTAARTGGHSDRDPNCQRPKLRRDRRLTDSTQYPDPSSGGDCPWRPAVDRNRQPDQAVVAKMCPLMAWPDYDQADAFRFNKVINEPDFLPLHVVRQLVQAASLVRVQHGKLVATPLGESLLSEARQGSLLAVLFHLAFWHMDLGYFGAGCSGPGPRKMPGLCFGHCRPAPMNGNPPRN